ncbi:hypothetical protein [Microbulbifer sp. YPW16]|uniref:hypothetical protein n=1 Tax=Microbulbifer sp. YPW16 TaxID=2904242 RepID=UPI001E2C6E0C|nr:hypothetical protein [Microbulbifer sp. YPW16]UHQ55867.1 hypothetical protein LVE68_02435 [Microbulbifer sp. YPW16]
MDSVDKLLIEKYRAEQEKGEYLFNRLALGYARVYAFRRSFLGRLIGHFERAVRYLTFRPSAKSELTQMYEAALQFEEEHNISLREVLAQAG